MSSISVLPVYPVPARPCSVVFDGAGNHVRVWAVGAPLGSALRAKIDASPESRVQLYDGPSGPSYPLSLVPDAGGVYLLFVLDLRKGSTPYGGTYEGDPSAGLAESKAGPDSTVSLRVGERMEQRVGRSPDSAVLAWHVFGDSVRATTVAVHGEATPSLTKPGSSRAQVACESSSVRAALAALAGLTVAAAVGDLQAVLSDVISAVSGHMGRGPSVHAAADAANPPPPGAASSYSDKALPALVSSVLASLRRHYSNDDGGHTPGVTPGQDSAAYHAPAGAVVDDVQDVPVFDSAGDTESAFSALADVRRSYEAHRVSAVHGAPDVANRMAALPPLLALHEAFMQVVASSSPPAPPTVNSGTVTAVQQAGFRKT